MKFFILLPLCFAFAVGDVPAGDNMETRSASNCTKSGESRMEHEDYFNMRQKTSFMVVGPSNPQLNYVEYDDIVLRSWSGDFAMGDLVFIPVEGFGHFGHLRHKWGEYEISPEQWTDFPGDNYRLQTWMNDWEYYKSMFAYDEANQHVVHISEGKVWRPQSGLANPSEKTRVVIHEPEGKEFEKFLVYFRTFDWDFPAEGELAPTFYSDPNIYGDWKMVRAFLEPAASYHYEINFKEGMSETSSVTSETSWMFSAGFAKGLFSASSEYSGFVQQTSSSTWESEITSSFEVTVKPGNDTVIWRFVFEMDQYGDKFDFQSTVIADSHDINVKPTLESYVAGKHKYKIKACSENTD